MSTLKKLAIVALSVVTIVSTSGAASAVTLSELQGLSRDELLSLLTQLLAGGTTTTTGGTSSVACTFTRNMYPGVSGADVKCLQQYLNGAGYTISTSGAGAPGSESEYYGTKTQAAVKKWQDAMGLSYGSWGQPAEGQSSLSRRAPVSSFKRRQTARQKERSVREPRSIRFSKCSSRPAQAMSA